MSLRRAIASSILGKKYKVWHADAPLMGDPKYLYRRLADWGIEQIVDVGANVGQYADDVRAHGFAGHIDSFEPDPAPFRDLEANAAANKHRWSIHNLALGAADGVLSFNQFSGSQQSSFLSANDDMGKYSPSTVTSTIEVQVRTLDSLVAENALTIAPNAYLKLDTQGFDIEVLKGALATLPRFKGLQVELAFASTYEGAPHASETIAFLAAQGFNLMNLTPVVYDHTQGQMIEADGLFVNQKNR